MIKSHIRHLPTMMLRMLLLMIVLLSTFPCTTPQSLSGFSSNANVANTLDGGSSYDSNIILSLAVPVTADTDAVLLLVNMNVLATSGFQACAFTIYRGSTDLAPAGTVMVDIDPTVNDESQTASFSFMDVPGSVGTFVYTVRGKNYDVRNSANSQQ